jgi:general secretion pathway protein F
MPLFFYRAYGAAGELAEGQIEAASVASATELLWSKRLTPFEISPVGRRQAPWWRRDIVLSRNSFQPPQLANFTREFATLMAAGIPLTEALRMLVDEAASPRLRQLLETVLTDVLGGAALSEALAKHRDSFSEEYVSIIRAAEVTGTHAAALDQLGALLERRAELRARVQSALLYPSILIMMSVVSLGIITGVLVPSIAPIFQESGARAPAAISMLLALHEHWQAMVAALALTSLVSAAGFTLAMRDPATRIAFDRWKLQIPAIGPFLLKQETARFTRTLGTLLKAGVSVLQAAESAGAIVRNSALAEAIGEALSKVREGAPLHKALQEATPLPPLALRMIAIGERAADLDNMLLRVASIFEQQTQRSLDRLMTLLTPAITLVVALLVGLLIVTIMNAVLSLNDIAVGQ